MRFRLGKKEGVWGMVWAWGNGGDVGLAPKYGSTDGSVFWEEVGVQGIQVAAIGEEVSI